MTEEGHIEYLRPEVALVIFDFDGVVADSEMISLGTLQASLCDLGIDMSLEALQARFLGTSVRTIATFLEDNGRGDSFEAFRRDWEARLFTQFRSALRPMSGIESLLDDLDDAGIAYCIASSSSFERLGVALSAIGLEQRFNHVFSAELVSRGKPAPDLFLHAAEKLATRPEECVVIEDSPVGIAAAEAAGMRAIGFLGGDHLARPMLHNAHAELLKTKGASCVVRSHTQIRLTRRQLGRASRPR
ncbi:HAD family hydrolase [Palleronia caenipelagi]|uniref:HAD family phosphatase n=1 Tax=Palleronia caenipelagi TaxID=2489174 RepID=A0A547PNF6_9RHOB|nr:HAD family phosphatase [Palleronia caenipelagi]TRD15677.1 HAD family phosphatase [Palleronia caenipelagi]